MNESTKETVPFHIWAHEVEISARARGGVDFGNLFRDSETRARMMRAYQTGESVWMVADEMRFRARGRAIAISEDKDGRGIIARVRR